MITASPADYHPDHEATSVLVRDACFAAPVPNYETGVTPKPLPAIPHLYFCDPIEGRDRAWQPVVPDFAVTIESTFARKCEMLAVHKSQQSWVPKQHGVHDFLESMEVWTRKRGKEFGVNPRRRISSIYRHALSALETVAGAGG